MKTQFNSPFGVLARNPHKLNAGKLREAYVTRTMLEMFEGFGQKDCFVLALGDMAARKERYGELYEVNHYRLHLTHDESEFYMRDLTNGDRMGCDSFFIQDKIWDFANRVIEQMDCDEWLRIIVREKSIQAVGRVFIITLIEELMNGPLSGSHLNLAHVWDYRAELVDSYKMERNARV